MTETSEPTQEERRESHIREHIAKCPKIKEIVRWCSLAQMVGNEGAADIKLLQWAAREIIELRDRIAIMEKLL